MNLNADQQRACATIRRRLAAGEPLTEVTGPAGTGKSTILADLIKDMHPLDPDNPEDGGYVVCAPTNKAVSVLRRKGIVGATTAHTLTSRYNGRNWAKINELKEKVSEYEDRGEHGLAESARKKIDEMLQISFSSGGSIPGQHADVIFVDEGGMLSEEIAQRVMAFNRPVVVFGDPYQLPPVKAKPFFLTGSPHAHLEQIMRVDEQSDILHVATKVRNGESLKVGMKTTSVVISDKMPSLTLLSKADSVLVGKHKTRMGLNRRLRAHMGFNTDTVGVGEPLVVVRGQKDLDIHTSERVSLTGSPVTSRSTPSGATRVRQGLRSLDDPLSISQNATFPLYLGWAEDHWNYHKDRYHQDAQILEITKAIQLDLGYAMTGHRSQGSEWDKVAVVYDGWGVSKEEKRRWLYTVITRARKSLYVAVL